ncbi:hypothetical protein GCM10025857_31000 [Alicyclobacillus contaminans]|nr:hypothetical protein GCM10025857_31000 [Alicyclobacillus contaminans]
MNRRKLLTTISVLFSLITIILISCEYIFVESPNGAVQVTRWALLSLSLMFLSSGLNMYIDKRLGGLAYMGAGLFLAIVVVTKFALHM